MKRLSIFFPLLFGCVLLIGADGCSSDPNVEGAKLDLRNRDYDRALENLDTAIASNPDNAEAHELKGRALSEKAFTIQNVEEHSGLIAQMVSSYERAVALDPTLADAITQAMRIAYSNEFQLGIQAFNRGKNDETEYGPAAAFFASASVIQPDSASAYVNQAYALMNANRSDDAMGPFEMSIEKGDTDIETYRFLSRLYQSSERLDEAVTLLETASSLYPESDDVQAELLNAYQLAGQIDRAMSVYESAVERDPDNKLFRYNYGSLLTQVERYDEAIVQLRAAIVLDPDYANAHYNLGAAFINQAVVVNTRISAFDDDLRANRSDFTSEQIKEKDDEINRLADLRRDLFAKAIGPLEAARVLMEAADEDATEVCVALFQSYVHTNAMDSAEGVSECAGFDDENRP